MGDNTGPSTEEIEREKEIKLSLTTHLRQAVQQLQKQHVNSEEPIYSQDAANAVCNVFEAIFLHGLKPSMSKKFSGFLGGVQEPSQLHFWEFVTKFSHRDIVSQLNHLGQITTQIGMCRAWIRLALNDSLLESYLAAMLRDSSSLRSHYRRTAYLRDIEQPTIMVSYIQGLSQFNFALSYNSSVLNMWTTSPLALAGLVQVQALTPRPVLSPVAAEEALPDKSSPVDASTSITPKSSTSTAAKARVISSMAYTGSGTDHTLAQALSTPPNTPYDPSHFPPNEMEQIRRMIESKYSGSDDSSTATSQVSCPDSTDQRMFPQQCISPQRRASGTDYLNRDGANDVSHIHVTGVVRSKVRTKHGRTKKLKRKYAGTKKSDSTEGSPCRVPEIAVKQDQLPSDYAQTELLSVPKNAQNEDQLGTNNILVPRDTQTSEIQDTSTPLSSQPKTCNVLTSDDGVSSSDTKFVNSESDKNAAEPLENEQGSLINNDQSQIMLKTTQSSTSTLKCEQPSQKSSGDTLCIEQEQSNIEPIPSNQNDVALEEDKHDSIYTSTGPSDKKLNGTRLEKDKHIRHFTPPKKSMAPPELSNAMATANGVDEAREMIEDDIQIFDGDPPDANTDAEKRPAVPRGNSLGLLQGWSSEFEDQSSLYDSYGQDNAYIPGPIGGTRPRYLDAVERQRASQQRQQSTSERTDSAQGGVGSGEEFEILTDDDTDFSIQEARVEAFKELLCEIQHERGLDFHNFQCKGCKRPVGLFFCNPRICGYDGGYYCYECHESNEFYIPARILHNWDFQKYPVSGANLVLLRQFEDTPLVNVNQVNPRLYDHVPEMQEVKALRTQLRFLKAYLFTCKQSVADELRRQVSPKEYLYDDIHMYALLDLLAVVSGQLEASLKRVSKWACAHVYACGLCSGKGFICEICHHPKVIYPFEMNSTYRCDQCEAVYHEACKTPLVPCPKCKRIMQRNALLGNHAAPLDNDYSYSMEA